MEQFGLPVLLALLLGSFLKRDPKISNKLIPYLLFASQFIGRLALEVGAASAGMVGDAAQALGNEGLNMAMGAAISTVLAVGAHSSFKNGRQALPIFLGFLKQLFFGRVAEATAKAADKAK